MNDKFRAFNDRRILRPTTPILGSSAGAWNTVLVGHLDQSMEEIRQALLKAKSIERQGIVTVTAGTKSTDVASVVRSKMAERKR